MSLCITGWVDLLFFKETTRRSAAATHSLLLPVLQLTNLTKNLCKAAALLLPLPLRLIACQFDVKLLFCLFSPFFCHERYQIYAIIHHSFILVPIIFLHFWSLMKGYFSKIGFMLNFFFFSLSMGRGGKGGRWNEQSSKLVLAYLSLPYVMFR